MRRPDTAPARGALRPSSPLARYTSLRSPSACWGRSTLGLERLQLGVASDGEADGGVELAFVDRLGQVRGDAGGNRAVDETTVIDAGHDDGRAPQPCGGEPARYLHPVEPGHIAMSNR